MRQGSPLLTLSPAPGRSCPHLKRQQRQRDRALVQGPGKLEHQVDDGEVVAGGDAPLTLAGGQSHQTQGIAHLTTRTVASQLRLRIQRHLTKQRDSMDFSATQGHPAQRSYNFRIQTSLCF